MFIRQLSYLIALDKYRHFARAANSCHVSQPSLSVALRQLENELGITIIQRNRRFIGFTHEGKRVLDWARKTVASLDGLRQEAAFSRIISGGHLAIGVVPSALFAATLLIKAYRRVIPDLTVDICSLSTSEIHRRIKEHQLHLGLAYHEEAHDKAIEHMLFYKERFVLLSGPGSPVTPGKILSWKDVSRLPLCLFSQEMNNRRILDEAFSAASLIPDVVIETNTASVFIDLISSGELYSVAPVSAIPESFLAQGIQVNSILNQPDSSVHLLRLAQQNTSALLETFWEMVKSMDIQNQIDAAVSRGKIVTDY